MLESHLATKAAKLLQMDPSLVQVLNFLLEPSQNVVSVLFFSCLACAC